MTSTFSTPLRFFLISMAIVLALGCPTKKPLLSSENTLSSCSVEVGGKNYNVDISATEPTGSLNLPYGSDLSTLKVATIEVSPKAKASLSVGSSITVSNKTFTIDVTAEDGTVNNYTITIVIGSPNTEAKILSFSFEKANNSQVPADVVATITKDTIKATFPFGTDPNLIPTFSLSAGANAKVKNLEQSSGKSKQDFSSAVNYVVTAQDGKTTKTYVVMVRFFKVSLTLTIDVPPYDEQNKKYSKPVLTWSSNANFSSYEVQRHPFSQDAINFLKVGYIKNKTNSVNNPTISSNLSIEKLRNSSQWKTIGTTTTDNSFIDNNYDTNSYYRIKAIRDTDTFFSQIGMINGPLKETIGGKLNITMFTNRVEVDFSKDTISMTCVIRDFPNPLGVSSVFRVDEPYRFYKNKPPNAATGNAHVTFNTNCAKFSARSFKETTFDLDYHTFDITCEGDDPEGAGKQANLTLTYKLKPVYKYPNNVMQKTKCIVATVVPSLFLFVKEE